MSPNNRHADTVALVTGSTHGIGLGTARRLAREGAAVVINDEGGNDGERIASKFRDDGAEAIYVQADAADSAAISRLVEQTVAEFGRIDVLVNNVGGWNHTPADRTDVDTWEFVMNACVRSHWLTTRDALEHVPEGGSIVNISSIHSKRTNPVYFPYNVAKSAVNGLTRALAIELGPRGIRVNAILPGAIETSNPDATDEELKEQVSGEPVGRKGAPRDIAGAVSFLASDDAAFINGVTLPVDGGRSIVLDKQHNADWWTDFDE